MRVSVDCWGREEEMEDHKNTKCGKKISRVSKLWEMCYLFLYRVMKCLGEAKKQKKTEHYSQSINKTAGD